ncbi:DJ-1/PfpI family protein, partial [Nodularia sphaerocarpa]|uniref:DJ-1/PfpI family protein n=1 Tax=Nodularia sphaerocarpa TaxID=137816 RepID=UPI00232E9239
NIVWFIHAYLLSHFAQANKPIAAICHGLQLFAAADFLQGKTSTGYPACSPEGRIAGGVYIWFASYRLRRP